jgi:hypothetical protein
MPETSPLLALATALLALALLLLPGWLVLRLIRVRGLLALALAPACSTAVLACGAILAQLVGVRWSMLVVAASTAVALAVALAVRRLTSAGPDSPRTSHADGLLLAVGVLLAAVPTIAAMPSIDAYLQRWDAVFHLAALRFADETGSVSTLTLGALSYGDGHASIYPAGWHAIGSLLPGSPTAALAIGATVTAALPWVLGCGVLATELTRVTARPFLGSGVIGMAGVLAGLVTASPMSLWAGWGHVPNAAALAMLPAALALGLRLLRDPSGRPAGVVALLVTLLGIGLTHPNAVLATAVLALPACIGAWVRAVRSPAGAGGRGQEVVAPALASVAAVGLLLVFLVTPLAAAVTGYTSGEVEPPADAALEVVTGWYRLWPSTTGVVVAVLAVIGAVIALIQRRRLPALVLLVSWVVYIDAATGGVLKISSLWYTSAARLSVVVSTVAVPLAAGALVAAAARWRVRLGTVAVTVAAAVLVVAITAPSISGRVHRTANVFESEPGHPPQFVTTGEIEMIAGLPGLLDGAILGSPFSGASSAYGLVGTPVVFPVAGQVWSADQQLVMEHLEELESGTVSPEVCAALERLDVRYLYQDGQPYQADPRYDFLDAVEPAGATVIAQGDSARVLELATCRG